ncbi:MAG: DUF86 domain-containing protein [Cyanobacteria bacterium P01_H01_bin.121]
MSSRGWLIRVQDILNAIESIQSAIGTRTFEEFTDDSILLKAVLYDFVIIGEAAANIPTEIRAKATDIPWRLMADMRNVITHEYFRVDPEIIWDTVQLNLPGLVRLLEQFLATEQAQD